MKEKWFEYVVINKNLWIPGFTIKRLEKIKPAVFLNEHIMWDLLERHSGKEQTPEEMKEKDNYK